jgi:hypothetical protein
VTLTPPNSSGSSDDGFTTVTKAVDESLAANTTLQADDELTFATVAGTPYEVELYLYYASPAGGATPDIKVALGEDATARGQMSVQYLSAAADTPTVNTKAADSTTTSDAGTNAGNRVVVAKGVYYGAGSPFRVLWAQINSNANPVIVRAGSTLAYRALAPA